MNALKSVNDFGSYESGDDFLLFFASILSLGNQGQADLIELKNFQSQTKIYCEKNHLKITPATFSEGDEFCVLVIGKNTLTQKTMDDLIKIIKKDMTQIDTSRILDFKNPKIIEKCKNQHLQIPANFVLPLTASFGSSSLLKVLHLLYNDDVFWEKESNDYETLINHLMRIFFAFAEKESKDDKKIFKDKLKNSSLPAEKFYSEIMLRSEATVKLSQEIDTILDILNYTLEKSSHHPDFGCACEKIVLSPLQHETLSRLIQKNPKLNGTKEILKKMLI